MTNKNALYYYTLGVDAFEKKEYVEAIKRFELSQELMKHFKTLEHLYSCYDAIGNRTKAKECIQEAFLLNSNNSRTAVLYASILLEEGDKNKSLQVVNQVLEKNPSYNPAKKILERLLSTQ
ncbi:tetratricopeptide repeat protein [Paenibacillus sp. GCM10023252]|uniref:tetratricopeptide repeat protein n=1 Tax=Paenibacillus sp. GCM10023252 TaxID=3252649 RepID=UPI0036089D98